MKILLVGKHSSVEPLGLMYLAAVLQGRGHDVDFKLVDQHDGNISTMSSDAVGFSVYTGFHRQMFKLADVVGPDKVVIGGPHASFFSQDCLRHAGRVVKGEGFVSAIRAFEGEQGVVFEPSLVPAAEIPWPARDKFYSTYPEYGASRIKSVMASFGCPYSCSYCYNDEWGRMYPGVRVRVRPVESVVGECRSIQSPTEMIYFQDDCFGYNLDWLRSFAGRYRSGGRPFHCQLRVEMVTHDRLKLLKEAGCHGVTIAIETFHEETRKDLLHRRFSNQDVLHACELIKRYGLRLRTEQMLGLPWTSLEDEYDLLKLNVQINPDVAWTSVFVPYLGTELGDRCVREGVYRGTNDDLGDSFFEGTRLEFDDRRRRATNMLQDIFMTCAKFPNGDVLARRVVRGVGGWSSTVKQHLYDNCLFV